MCAQDQLRLEQDNYNNAESLRKQLEVQLREITIRLDEAESTKDGKKPIAKLQVSVFVISFFCSCNCNFIVFVFRNSNSFLFLADFFGIAASLQNCS